MSGYDDYQFVHSAYSCGGFDYLLKPFSADEITKVMLSIQEKLELERALDGSMDTIICSELTHLVQSNSPMQVNSSIARLNAIQGCWAKDSVQILALYTQATRHIIEMAIGGIKRYVYPLFLEDVVLLVVRNTVRVETIIQRLHEELSTQGDFVGGIIFSAQKLAPNQLYSYCKRMEECVPYLFYADLPIELNIDRFCDYSFSKDSPPQVHKELAQEVLFGSTEKTQSIIGEYFQRMLDCKTDRPLVLESVFMIIIYFYENYILLNPELMMEFEYKSELLNRLNGLTHISQIKRFLTEYLLKIHYHFCTVKGNKGNDVVITAIRYIHHHFANPITVEEVAKEIYLSPNYIRTIFKEKTGKTILEYLTEYRMEKATELLRDKQYKVKQVGHLVGYDNESYFCATFLKTHGFSPSEYRKKFYGGI